MSAGPAAATGRWLLAAGLVATAFNLRPVFSSLPVVLPEIMRDLALSPAAASVLTTVPVLSLGLFAPLAPALAARFGPERVIGALLAILTVGTALRGLATVPALLVGSILAGGSIAVVNVLLPGLVKRDFPARAALMTGITTMALTGGAALAAGLTVPLERLPGGSWAGALAAWALPGLAALALWMPQVAQRPPLRPAGSRRPGALWREGLAWQVTLFMGFQAALAYAGFGWIAPVLRERGFAADAAGYLLSASIFAQMAASLVAPALAMRGRDQRGIALALTLLAAGSFVLLVVGPLWLVWPAALAQGAGQGALLALAMTMIILRSPDMATAARLSGMAQGIGYLMAAAGPLVLGLIRDTTGSFAAAAPFLAGLGLGCALMGWSAGRDRVLRAA